MNSALKILAGLKSLALLAWGWAFAKRGQKIKELERDNDQLRRKAKAEKEAPKRAGDVISIDVARLRAGKKLKD